MRARTGKWGVWSRSILGLTVALGIALGFGLTSAGSIYDYEDTVDGVRLPAVQAIVVLAGGRGRIGFAGDLWNRYREMAPHQAAPSLYLSGVGPQTTFKGVQGQLRPGVREVLKTEQVVIENESTNTEENARWLVRYARERGWDRVLLVTSSYHMKRARLIFDQILENEAIRRNALRAAEGPRLSPVQLETLSVFQDPFEPGEWISSVHGIRVTLGEYLKWLYYSRFWQP
jgi:uncharacterized SAM-binding protein YcdF (DUF218 family)